MLKVYIKCQRDAKLLRQTARVCYTFINFIESKSDEQDE